MRFNFLSTSPICVSSPTWQQDGPSNRVSFRCGDRGLWFESNNVSLLPAPTTAGCALWIPALANRTDLILEGEVCPEWFSHLSQIGEVLHTWWNYSPHLPQVQIGEHSILPRSEGAGLCFSGGVDSFHTLLKYDQPIRHLVFVHGFDIGLEMPDRAAVFAASLEKIAAEFGVKSILIRTNLRQLPFFNSVAWERTRGGALAAIGHLLSEHMGQFVISSSCSYSSPQSC